MVWREHWLPNFYTTGIEPHKMRKHGKSNWEGSLMGVEEALLFSNQSTWTPLQPPHPMDVHKWRFVMSTMSGLPLAGEISC